MPQLWDLALVHLGVAGPGGVGKGLGSVGVGVRE